MNAKKNLLSGIVIGVLLCVLSFILFSSVIFEYSSFILGVLICLLFFFCILFFGKISSWFNNKSALAKADSKSKNLKPSWLFFSFFLIIACMVGSSLIYEKKKNNKIHTQLEERKIEQQSEMAKSVKAKNLYIVMSEILNKVDEEVKNEPVGQLSEEIIDRITALNNSFNPYKRIQGDSLLPAVLSPERGQLLLSLLNMGIDSSSFKKIIQRISFEYVDLNGAELRGVNLSGAKLRGASLRNADLKGANLKGADLRGADLWGSDLEKAMLKDTKLNRAELSWANLIQVDLENAVLSGADLTSAKLQKANLTNAEIRWASLRGAFLSHAILKGIDLYGTNLVNANLNNADLTDAKLIYANLNEALIEDAIFINVNLILIGVAEKDWLEKLNEWRVVGAKDIQERFRIELDKSKRTKYHLKKIE